MSENSLEQVVRQLRGATQSPPVAALADRELLQRFASARDDLAFAEIVRRHGPMVLGVCTRTLRDAHRAEDAFQAVFLVLARKAGSLRRPELLGNWLYGVAYRVAREARARGLRKEARERRLADMQEPMATTQADCGELARVLDEELSCLPEKYRVAFVLCHLEGKTHEQAAAALKCPVGSMSWRLEQARELLRQRLTRRGITVTAALAAAVLSPQSTSAVVPAALATATVRAALALASGTGAVASIEILELAQSGLSRFPSGKHIVTAAILLLGVAGAGTGALMYRRLAIKPSEVPQQLEWRQLAVADEPPPVARRRSDKTRRSSIAFDRFGDLLPEGAVVRLGTERFHPPGQWPPFLAYNRDGSELISADREGWIVRWDPATGRQIDVLKVPDGSAGDNVLMSADGRLAAYSDSQKILVWDTRTGSLVRKISWQGVSWAALSPDGRLLANFDSERNHDTDGENHFLMLRDVRSGSLLRRMRWSDDVGRLSFSPDGQTLVCAGSTIELWNVAAWQQRKVLRPPNDDRSIAVAYSTDSKLIASWARRSAARGRVQAILSVWNAQTGKQLFEGKDVEDSNPFDHALVFSPDGKTVASAGAGAVRFWNVGTGKIVRKLESPFLEGPGATSDDKVAFSPDGKTIAWSLHGALCQYDVATGKARTQPELYGYATSLSFTPDGRSLASAHPYKVNRSGNAVRLWDAKTGRELRQFGRPGPESRDLAFSPDGRMLAASAWPNLVDVWNVASGAELGRFVVPDAEFVKCRNFSSDGRMLYASSVRMIRRRLEDTQEQTEKPSDKTDRRRGRVRIERVTIVEHQALHAWEIAGGKESLQCRFEDAQGAFLYDVLSPDASLLASPGGLLRQVPRTDRSFALERPTVGEGGDPYVSFSFARDGRTLASSARGTGHIANKSGYMLMNGRGDLVVWEVATGRVMLALPSRCSYVALSADGRIVVDAYDAIRVWDVCTGKELLNHPGPDILVTAIALSPDGKTLATGLRDSTVLLWDISQAVEAARRSTPDHLSLDRLNALWGDMASADAAKSQVAVHALAGAPKDSVPFLGERLRPEPAMKSEETRRLVADLDNGRFQTREDAFQKLQRLGELAEPALRQAQKGRLSPEAAKRIGDLLSEPGRVRSSEVLRGIRAIQALELIGSPEARQILQSVATGFAELA